MQAPRSTLALSRTQRRWLLATLTLLLTVSSFVLTQAYEEEAPPKPDSGNPGLKGLLPLSNGEAFPPDELSIDAFLDTEKYLEDWMSEVADLVAELYSEDPGDIAKQRKTIATLREKRLSMLHGASQPKHAAARAHLLTMAARLQRRLDLLEAALDVLEQHPPANTEKKKPAEGAEEKKADEEKKDSDKKEAEEQPEKMTGNLGNEVIQAAYHAGQRVQQILSAEDAARMDKFLAFSQLQELKDLSQLTGEDLDSLSRIDQNFRTLTEMNVPQSAVLKEPELQNFATAVSRLLAARKPASIEDLPAAPALIDEQKEEEGEGEKQEENGAENKEGEGEDGKKEEGAEDKKDDENLDDLRQAMKEFLQAVEDYEASNTRIARQKADEAVEKIVALAPVAGARLKDVYLRYYANFNLHVMVSESIVGEYVNDTQTNTSAIRDFILGANIFGHQTTTATVTADVKPAHGHALINFYLVGDSDTNTVGVAKQCQIVANVYTKGDHHFKASKEVTFDGRCLKATGAEMWVDPNNRTLGAKTNISCVPLLGSYADRTAFRRAEEQRPQSEAIAAHKLRDRVKEEFDTEVAQSLYEGNMELDATMARWTREGVAPSVVYASSTETHLSYAARVMNYTELSAERVPEKVPPVHGMLVQVHESLLNNVANTYPIAGRKLTLEQLSEILEQKSSSIMGRPVDLPELSEKKPAEEQDEEKNGDKKDGEEKNGDKKDEPKAGDVALLDEEEAPSKPEEKRTEEQKKTEEEPTVFDFDKQDPIRFKVERGQVIVTLKAGLEISLEEQGEFQRRTISPRIINIPFTPELKGNKIVLVPGEVTVFAVDDKAPDIRYNKGISTRLTDTLSKQEIEGVITLPREGKSSLQLRVTSFEALNGWVNMILE